jgi:hypothetical protein
MYHFSSLNPLFVSCRCGIVIVAYIEYPIRSSFCGEIGICRTARRVYTLPSFTICLPDIAALPRVSIWVCRFCCRVGLCWG